MPDVLLIAGGLAVLIVGAEFLVRGGTGLAAWLGIRPMVIGATVVSLGTSVPELAIGIDAALTGSPDLAVGNIVGTNLVNILLILGLSAARSGGFPAKDLCEETGTSRSAISSARASRRDPLRRLRRRPQGLTRSGPGKRCVAGIFALARPRVKHVRCGERTCLARGGHGVTPPGRLSLLASEE
jgi:Sodium/calcium exchanger protein